MPCIGQVCQRPVQPGPAPGFPRLFPHTEHIAEVAAPCSGRHFAMKFHVILQFRIKSPAVEEIANATEEFTHGGFLFPCVCYAVRNMLWIACVTRSYSESSAFRCLRPSGVRR